MKTEQKKIIVVDDNNTNLTVCKNILKPHYMVYPVPSAAKMFGLMENVVPDLVLMDVDMPDMNGFEAVGRMKKHETFKDIPFIFLSGRVDPASEIFGLNMGALDYIHKPFVSELLIRRIKTHLSLIESQKILEERNKPIEKSLLKSHDISTSLKEIISILDRALAAGDADKMKNCINEANTASKELFNQISNIFNVSKMEVK